MPISTEKEIYNQELCIQNYTGTSCNSQNVILFELVVTWLALC